MAYIDVLHIYGVSRAGYIPQLVGLRLPNPDVIFELLQKGNAKALIYDTSWASLLSHSQVPVYPALNAKGCDDVHEVLPEMPTFHGDDTVFIFHTSGSTSIPKLLLCSYSWLTANIDKMERSNLNSGRRAVTSAIGSMVNGGQNLSTLNSVFAAITSHSPQ
jgi:non-ribosomal peptide synthetase component F